MKKILTVEVPHAWVLNHRTDDELPIFLLERVLSDALKLKVRKDNFVHLSVFFDDESVNEADLKQKIVEVVKSNYSNDCPPVTFECYNEEPKIEADDDDDDIDLDDDDKELEKLLAALSNDDDDDEEDDDVFDDDDDEQDTKKKRPAKKQEEHSEVLEQIDNLVGAVEFKQIAREIVKIAPEIRERKTYDVFSSQSYLFSIGDGSGASTCVELFAKLIAELRIKSGIARGFIEHKLPHDRDTANFDPFEDVKDILRKGRPSEWKVLCIDISEWMNFTERAKFRDFLRMVEKASNCFIVIFRIPFVEKDVLERIQTSLSDLLYVRAVTFPPLTRNELQSGAKRLLQDYGFSVQKSAWQYFDQRIAMEKSDGKFYEISTVKKVVNEIIYKKQLANATSGKSGATITCKDMQRICPTDIVLDENTSGEAQLKALIGNEKIRARLDEVLAQIDLALKSDTERPCIHMRFVGNPGTGKTTIARILGKILKERGILRIGNFYEYAGRDFCGRYIGETAPKTASMCRDAYGSVMFIDEAYSLYKEGSTNDFGREAIDTLIAEMENHRNDFVVIMAGYTEEMNRLMHGNLGLASRMPYTIEFPNFTRDELYDIFKSMVTSKFKFDDKLLPAAKNYFANLSDEVLNDKSFSNARYVRNLFERTWAKASLRTQLEGGSDVMLTKDDFDRASADAEFTKQEKKRSRIGF